MVVGFWLSCAAQDENIYAGQTDTPKRQTGVIKANVTFALVFRFAWVEPVVAELVVSVSINVHVAS